MLETPKNVLKNLPELENDSREKFHKRFDRLFAALAAIMAPLSFVLVGISIGTENVPGAIINAVLAVFWAGTLFILHQKRLDDVHFEHFKRSADLIDKLAEAAAKHLHNVKKDSELAEDHTVEDHLMAIINDVTGGDRPPRIEDIEQIQARFNAETGLHVKLELVAGGINVQISDRPSKPKEAPKTAEKKPQSKSKGRSVAVQKTSTKKTPAKKPAAKKATASKRKVTKK